VHLPPCERNPLQGYTMMSLVSVRVQLVASGDWDRVGSPVLSFRFDHSP
jgi:hypothetical protein